MQTRRFLLLTAGLAFVMAALATYAQGRLVILTGSLDGLSGYGLGYMTAACLLSAGAGASFTAAALHPGDPAPNASANPKHT